MCSISSEVIALPSNTRGLQEVFGNDKALPTEQILHRPQGQIAQEQSSRQASRRIAGSPPDFAGMRSDLR
jgi:hypothetical protein